MGQLYLFLDQLCGPDTILVTIRRVAVTTHAALRTPRPALWLSFVPPGRTLKHQEPRWAQSLCELWPKSLERFEPVDGEIRSLAAGTVANRGRADMVMKKTYGPFKR